MLRGQLIFTEYIPRENSIRQYVFMKKILPENNATSTHPRRVNFKQVPRQQVLAKPLGFAGSMPCQHLLAMMLADELRPISHVPKEIVAIAVKMRLLKGSGKISSSSTSFPWVTALQAVINGRPELQTMAKNVGFTLKWVRLFPERSELRKILQEP